MAFRGIGVAVLLSAGVGYRSRVDASSPSGYAPLGGVHTARTAPWRLTVNALCTSSLGMLVVRVEPGWAQAITRHPFAVVTLTHPQPVIQRQGRIYYIAHTHVAVSHRGEYRVFVKRDHCYASIGVPST